MKRFRSYLAALLALLMGLSFVNYLKIPVAAEELDPASETGVTAEDPEDLEIEEELPSETEDTDINTDEDSDSDISEEPGDLEDAEYVEEAYSSQVVPVQEEDEILPPVEDEHFDDPESINPIFDPELELTQELILQRLDALREQYPAGKYWNHMGSTENNVEGYTEEACSYHPRQLYPDSCTCNYIEYNGRNYFQCWGYAMMMSQKLYGSYFMRWNTYVPWNPGDGKMDDYIKPGDVIKFGYGLQATGHTFVVLGVSGNIIRLADCNANEHCDIRWDAETLLNTTEVHMDSNYNGLYRAPAAFSFLPEGYCGKDITYTIDDDGVLTITGSGYIENKVFENNTDITKVIIGEGVKGIGYRTFAGCTNLEEVVLPDSMKFIYRRAFYGCESLSTINNPIDLKEAGNEAFYGCPADLSELTGGLENTSGVRNIGKCGDNVSWTLYNDGTLILEGEGPTYDYTSSPFAGLRGYISKVEIREGITRLGDYLFASNNKTKEVLIPSSVTAFGDYCFRSCEEIETFTIAPGSHLETVGVQAFYGNKKVSSIKLGEGVTSFGSQAFYGCISLLTFTVPASVETIAEECFYNCESMATITFAEGSKLTSIGAKSFYSCDKLTCIVIPEGVTTLGYEMFYGSSNLSYAIFPSTLTAVGERPFAYTGIKDIYCYADPEQLTWRGSFGCPNPRLHVLSRFRNQYQEKFSDYRINVRALQISSYIGDLDSFGDMTLAGYSLSYDGDIALKFYMDVADSIVTNSNTVMTITVGSDSKTLRMSDAEQVTRDDKTYYVFKVNILPTQMCTYITAQISCRNRVSPAYKYCVRDYVLYLLEHQDVEEYAEALPFAKAMVNYGAAAMSAINGSVAGFPNAVLSAEDRQLGEVRFRNPGYSCELDDSVVFTGVSMTLGTENSMSLFFESEEELVFSCPNGNIIETGTVNVQVDADEPTYDEYYDEYYYERVEKTYQVVRIRNIKADEVFNNSYTIEIEGHGTVTYSPARYCYNVLHSQPYSYYENRIDSMVNMVKALYFFAQAVNDYKN